MKNVTLSAPEELIENARADAAKRGTTLNADFRDWLRSKTVDGELQAKRFNELMDRIGSYANAGRKFTREEMNER